jgi:hypothetical protein
MAGMMASSVTRRSATPMMDQLPQELEFGMKNLLAVVGDGDADPVLEAALLTARRFDSHTSDCTA